MAVTVDGSQNISVTTTHTWGDIVAAGSTNLITHTTTNGRTKYRWVGIITLDGAHTLNITDQDLELFRLSRTGTQRGQIIVRNGGVLNITRSNLSVIVYDIGYEEDSTRNLLRVEDSSSAINLYASSICLATAPSTINNSSAARIEICLNTITDSVIYAGGSLPAEGFMLNKLSGLISNLQLNSVGYSIDYSSDISISNLSVSNGIYAGINWTLNNAIVRNFSVSGTPTHQWYSSNQIFTTFVDSSINLADIFILRYNTASTTGDHKKAASHNLRITDTNGNVQNALVTYTGRTNGSAASNASGIVSEFILIFEETNLTAMSLPGTWGSYTKPLTLSDYSAYTREIRSYRHLTLSQSLTIGQQVGSPSQPFDLGLIIDSGVTQTNTATVGAYTGISCTATGVTVSGTLTTEQIFDFIKLYWRNNSGIVPTKVDRIADLGSRTATITGTATTTAKYADGVRSSGLIIIASSSAINFPILATGNLTFSTSGNYSTYPGEVSSTSVITVASGATNLTGWVIPSGATINVASGSATVNVTSTTGIIAGAGVTLQTPPNTFSAPNITNGFVNVRCRTSYYNPAALTTSNWNTATNQLTISGIGTKITTSSVIRLSGTDLPAPLLPENVYYPHTISGDAFTLSGTSGGGGSAIDLIDVGSGGMVAIILTELNIQLVSSGGYSFNLNTAAPTAGITLVNGDFLLFQAIAWSGSLQSINPSVSSKYHEELQPYSTNGVTTLTLLETDTVHNTYTVQENTDGYALSLLTVTGSSPTRYQFRVDSGAPGKVQLETEDPDRRLSSALLLLYFNYVQWTVPGMRLIRGQVRGINLNSIAIGSPMVDSGLSADLMVQSFPENVPLVIHGAGIYREDGQSWIALGSSIQHSPESLIAVVTEVEVPVNLSEEITAMLFSMAAKLGAMPVSDSPFIDTE